MKLDEIVETVEKLVPQSAELEFDRIGIIQPTSTDIQSIGVCVNLTDCVMQEAKRLGVDFLVIHHGHGDEIKQQVQQLGIGAYGAHLALDTMPGGLIDSFAKVVNLREPVQPLTFVYKGIAVKKGAVLGFPDLHLPSAGYLIDLMAHYFGSRLGQSRIVLNGYNANFNLTPVIVATGSAIRKEFLEQINQNSPGLHPRLFIAGGVKNGAEQYARKLGISLISVGDFESHYPGIQRFATILGKELQTNVVVIPDYKIR